VPTDAGGQVVIPEFLRPKSEGSSSDDEVQATPATSASGDADDRKLPPVSMLRRNAVKAAGSYSHQELEQTAGALQSTLAEFGLHSRVVGWISGPTVTTFKVQPGEGERVSRISNLEDDIALSLATDSVRIFAPIPGTSLVGIEIPNKSRENVSFGDILPYVKGGPLEFALGRDAEGTPMVADLAKMPHLLIAGTTGSGKSVVISSILMSLLMRTFPEDVRLIMIDPKRVEFAPYDGLPHLYVPVVTEPKQAASALQWAVSEMERRLKIFERIGVRKISTFNEKQAAGEFDHYDNPPAKMPYLVIVIDELSDLMMVVGKDVEASIVRIAQLGRAAGIHMIVATQRPSSNVVTGLIKANITNRIGLTVATGIDSRVILDQTGAEKLLGQGDMLFSRVDWGKPKRIQGCFVSDEEIVDVVSFVKEQSTADYHEEILSAVTPAAIGGGATASMAEAQEDDPLLWDAARIVVDSQLGSTSGLQRRLKVGYARAGRIMDMLEEKGIVGPPDGSKPREVLLDAESLAELEALEAQMAEEDGFGGL
uniref:DNA translocase FtsK n=1 Tax=Collinsella sp. D33t1_170424_A12 TaxID=2787135 RepID=UPI001E2EFCC5